MDRLRQRLGGSEQVSGSLDLSHALLLAHEFRHRMWVRFFLDVLGVPYQAERAANVSI